MDESDEIAEWRWPNTYEGLKARAAEVRELVENLEDMIFVLRDDGSRCARLGLPAVSRLYESAEQTLIPLLGNLIKLRDNVDRAIQDVESRRGG